VTGKSLADDPTVEVEMYQRTFTFDYSHWSHDKEDPNFATQDVVFEDLGGFILGNEVTFIQSATPATLESYQSWLRKRYNQDIRKLSAAWGMASPGGFSSFEAIPSQPPKPTGPVTAGGQAAEWWDWNQFNNWRVRE
jgi:hypothetical protein